MSTFNGIIEEIGYILVDHFEPQSQTYYFFLSHIHTDHTKGLSDLSFINYLNDNDFYVYTSKISKLILAKQYGSLLESRLKTIDVGRPTLFSLPNNSTLSVTALPAGHCLGSLMFLFETVNSRVLYTGDFRLENNEIEHYKALHTETGHVKQVDALYLDTTFLKRSHLWFPKRKESMLALCQQIRDWIDRSKEHILFIKMPAIFGSEWLFIQINSILKIPIFIFKNLLDPTYYENVYKFIPELNGVYTSDSSKTQIYASQKTNFKNNSKVRQLTTSAWYWNSEKLETGLLYELVGEHFVRVCNSEHSSYTEIVKFVDYLKPDRIIPCVEDEEILLNLKFVQKSMQKSGYSEEINNLKECESKILFGKELRPGTPDSLLDD